MTPTPNPSATQPSATSVLNTASAPAVNPEAMNRLGHELAARFRQYESDRRLAELKWERSARQFLGVYDPDVELNLDKNRSRAYPKLTRIKCVSMLSRLMNLLFPVDDKCWTVSPSAVPELAQADLQQVLNTVMAAVQGQGQKPDDEAVEQAIRDFALKRASRMELEIEDQLQELGGSRKLSWTALCRKVLMSGIQYGCGVVKGPFAEEQITRTWDFDATGKLIATSRVTVRPRYEYVPIWDYYPDMSAKVLEQMDGQFERMVMSKHQVIKLKDRPDFKADQIDKALRESPTGNYMRRAFETELRAIGVAVNVQQATRNKFEVLAWEGFVNGTELANCGVKVPEDKLQEDVRANVWILGNYVIKAEIDPWTQLGVENMPRYHHFIFEEDETFLLGNGLPAIMRDSQMSVCAATRSLLDNATIMRVFEVNTTLLSPDQDVRAIQPDMIIMREDEEPGTMNYPAVRTIDIPVHLEELSGIVRLFQGFADQETFVNAATGGDMERGPSEPFRTATGASMLRGDAALPFKDVVRNFDMFTESVIGSMLKFNAQFNLNPNIQGDFEAVARGATSLIAKEVLGIQLDNLAQTLTPEEKPYVNMRQLIRERVRVRDLDTDGVVYDDAKCDQIEQSMQQTQAQQAQQQQELLAAQIRQALADALKNISQAGKNQANADATTANTVLAALEHGLNPHQMGAQNGPQGTVDGTQAAGGPADQGTPVGLPAGGAEPQPAQAVVPGAPGGAGFPAAAMPAG